MSVYIACYRAYQEGSHILGVFSSLESAIARLQDFATNEEPAEWRNSSDPSYERVKVQGDEVFKMVNECDDSLVVRSFPVQP